MRRLAYIKLTLATSLTLAAVLCSPKGYAEQQAREIDRHYVDERENRQQVFKTLPGSHITPVKNQMIFTLMLNTEDAKIYGRRDSDDADRDQLKIDGYSVAPFLVFSGKHFGVGLSGEFGEAQTTFDSPSNSLKEQSRVRYHGLGIHMFYSPMEKASRARLTFVGGTQVLRVKHRATSNQGHDLLPADHWEQQNYQVSRSRVGANLSIKLIDSIAIIPWIDHTYTYTADLNSRLNNPNQDQRVQLEQRYAGDNQIIWQPGSNWQYGLDAALSVYNFEIHFGNVLAALLNNDDKSARIRNNSYSVSIIFQTPTN